MGRAYLSVVLAVGEIAALTGLYADSRSRLVDVVNWIALVVGIVGVTVAPLERQWGYLKTWRRDGGGPMWFLPLTVALLVALTVLVARALLS